MKLGEAMYKEQQQGTTGAAEDNSDSGSNEKNEKVVDAEFEEVKEDSKKA